MGKIVMQMEDRFRTPSHVVIQVLQSYGQASSHRCWSGFMSSEYPPDEYESPTLVKFRHFYLKNSIARG